VTIDMRLKQTLIASALALSAATGVAVASVGGDEPSDDPEQPTGAITARAEPARESAGRARVLVSREPGAVARLSWSTHDGSAVAGDDFDDAAGVVQFRSGERTKVVEVQIADDGRSEGAETLDVRFEALPGLNAGTEPAVTTVVIRD
jgi:Calx-beta domain